MSDTLVYKLLTGFQNEYLCRPMLLHLEESCQMRQSQHHAPNLHSDHSIQCCKQINKYY